MRVFVGSACLYLSLVFAAEPAVAAPASIKPVVDPQRVTFMLSVDDASVDSGGIALVNGYALEIFVAGSSTLVERVGLGKPPADIDGTVSIRFLPLLQVPLNPGVLYEAVVQADGPYGSSDSDRSNPFTFNPPPCDPWISPVSIKMGAAGGSSATMVHAAAGCAWKAVSDDPWITITGGKSGSGDGLVTFTVTANTGRNTRVGDLKVADVKLRVHEEGARPGDNSESRKHNDRR